MNQCNVFYVRWQMECCGKKIRPGDMVEWFVIDDYYMDPKIKLGRVDYYFEGHSSDWERLSILQGTVKEIKLLYTKYSGKSYLPGSKLLEQKLEEADETHTFEKSKEGFTFEGYLVTLGNCTIHSAKEGEKTWEE